MAEKRLTVAEEILREHEVVKEIIRQLEFLLDEGSLVGQESDWARRLCSELSSFRSHIQRHTVLEEDGGFMVEVVTLMPQATKQVEKLRCEHEQILRTIDELIHDCNKMASGAGLPLPEFRQSVYRAFAFIRRHESEENEMIQRVFYHEVAVAD
jgi:hemerythrin-like domain-containing protein